VRVCTPQGKTHRKRWIVNDWRTQLDFEGLNHWAMPTMIASVEVAVIWGGQVRHGGGMVICEVDFSQGYAVEMPPSRRSDFWW
jgi:hypothetical protein